jgi:nucleotide-binding universal stress UspA family protein
MGVKMVVSRKMIVVPTDFSPTADNAILYAIQFAELIDADVCLYHSFIPFESTFYPISLSKKENLKNELLIASRLLKIKKSFSKKYKDVQIYIKVDKGPEKTRLLEFCEANKTELIIMGTKGASSLNKIVIGSFTSNIMTNASCKVLAIPVTSKFKIPKKITFASNYNDNDLNPIKQLIDLNMFFNAQLNILHVDVSNKTAKSKEILFNKNKYKIEKHIKNVNLTFKHIAGKDPLESILQSTLKDKTDILVISPMKKEFVWTWLFHHSFTKAIAGQIHLPLLSIP